MDKLVEKYLLSIDELCYIKMEHIKETGIVRQDIADYTWAIAKAQLKKVSEAIPELLEEAKRGILTEVDSNIMEAKVKQAEAMADSDNPSQYQNASYWLGYEHANKGIRQALQSDKKEGE